MNETKPFILEETTAEERKTTLYENAKSYRNALISLEKIVPSSVSDQALLEAARRTLTVLMQKDQAKHDSI